MERLNDFFAMEFPLATLLAALWLAVPLPVAACGYLTPDPATVPPVVLPLAM